MLKRIALLFAALIFAPVQAFAQEEQAQEDVYSLEGFWAFQIDDAVIFLFEIDQMENGNWRARWSRPAEFGTNGVIFRQMSGTRRFIAESATEVDEGLQLSFPDPRPEAVPNVFLFELISDHQVRMTYVDTPLDPFPLIRVVPGTPLGPFDDDRIYDRDNAVTEADYIPLEPSEEIVPEAGVESEPEEIEEVAEGDYDPAGAGLSSDFLDELGSDAGEAGDGDAEDAADAAIEAETSMEQEAISPRACDDLDGSMTLADLDALWGENYVQIGSGLDIREYTMDNGDIARITMLGERVYVNSCGASD